MIGKYVLFDVFKDFVKFVPAFGTQHFYARVPEMRNALEEGRCRKMSADVENAPVFVDVGDAFGNLSA